MRSPTCLLESRVYSSKNLRSTVQKDFYNTIGTSETNGDEVRRSACGRSVLQNSLLRCERAIIESK